MFRPPQNLKQKLSDIKHELMGNIILQFYASFFGFLKIGRLDMIKFNTCPKLEFQF